MQRLLGVLCLLCAAVAGCDDRFITACPDIGVPRFRVSVTDARTGGPVAGALVRDSLSGGSLADRRFARRNRVRPDTAFTGASGHVDLGGRGGGLFSVVVVAGGYVPWRQDGLRVEADARCGIPTTVSVQVQLTPSRP